MHRQPRQETTTFLGPGPVIGPSSTLAGLPLSSTIGINPAGLPLSSTLSFPTAAVTSSGTTNATVEITPSAPASTSMLTSAPTSLTTHTPAPVSTNPITDPSFTFLLEDDATTCGVYTIGWNVSNPNAANLSGVGINLEVSGIDNHSFTGIHIVSNHPVLSTNFTWNPVNVPPGRYQISGGWSDNHGDAVLSLVFDVKSGHTFVCLVQATPTTTPSSLNKTAIVGGILGGIICLICLAFAFHLVSRRKLRGRGGGGQNSLDATASRDVERDVSSPSSFGNTAAPSSFRSGVTASITSLDALEKIPSQQPTTLEHMAPWATATTTTLAEAIPSTPDVELTRPTPPSVPESISSRSTLVLSPSSDSCGSDAGESDPSQPPSRHRPSLTTPAGKPVQAYTLASKELESHALARPHSKQARLCESRGSTFLDMTPTLSSPSSSRTPSPGVPYPPSTLASISMRSAQRSSWSANPPQRVIFEGH